MRYLQHWVVFFLNNHITPDTGDYTLVFIIILLVLVAAVTLMQSFESPALVSSFKGLLTLMAFVQSFVSLKVYILFDNCLPHFGNASLSVFGYRLASHCAGGFQCI